MTVRRFQFASLLIVLFAVSGCVTPRDPVLLLDGLNSAGAPVCLAEQQKIPSFVEWYQETRDVDTEESKIDYLLERIRSSERTYIRNDEEFQHAAAAQFFRWKLDRLRSRYDFKINTAGDFIEQIATMSRSSGKAYVVVDVDGTHHMLGRVLANELQVLNECLEDIQPDAGQALEALSADSHN